MARLNGRLSLSDLQRETERSFEYLLKNPTDTWVTELYRAAREYVGESDLATDWRTELTPKLTRIADHATLLSQAAECRARLFEAIEKKSLLLAIVRVEDQDFRQHLINVLFNDPDVPDNFREKAEDLVVRLLMHVADIVAFSLIYTHYFNIRTIRVADFRNEFDVLCYLDAKLMLAKLVASLTLQSADTIEQAPLQAFLIRIVLPLSEAIKPVKRDFALNLSLLRPEHQTPSPVHEFLRSHADNIAHFDELAATWTIR